MSEVLEAAKQKLVNQIMDFESGQMEMPEMVEFFASLIESGLAWSLQGSYGRMATSLIENRMISRSGEVLAYSLEEVS